MADERTYIGETVGGLEQLYRDQADAMVSLAYLLTGSRPLAQDIVHDAFVDVARRLEHVVSPGPYLRRAVVNRANSVLRRRAVERRHASAGVGAEAAVDHPDELWDALGRLPARQRSAIVLRFYAGMPDDEAADLLGVRPATVRSLIHRALANLRKAVER